MKNFEWFEPIDKLTNSIEEVATGKNFDTEIFELEKTDLKLLTKKKDWKFNWKEEWKNADAKVYKLVLMGDKTIQGIISIKDEGSYLYLPLIETAPHNFGKAKKFFGVPANLTAFACKCAFESGYDGEVAFIAKTELIEHYKKMLGATQLGGRRMGILNREARKLVSLYFKSFVL